MNIIFGIWRPQGPPVSGKDLVSMATHTRRFARDGEWLRLYAQIGMGVQAHCTNRRSRLDSQPTTDHEANVLLLYDGRLDNYREICEELKITTVDAADTEVIVRAYRQWGEQCFTRLVGDWAAVLWDGTTKALYLARDHAGTRTLYYSRNSSGAMMWSTYLDSFLASGLLDVADPVFIASYITMLPCYVRSPYAGVQSVPPGHVVKATLYGTISIQTWSPLVDGEIRYESHRDYEIQFLDLFTQAVARRAELGVPILAQLSGGMDSTAIVCMSDHLRRTQNAAAELLDTLSYFNDLEPAWNEKPYFTLVEGRRGKCGIHIDSSLHQSSLEKPSDIGALYLYPGIDNASIAHDRELRVRTGDDRYRSILSGIGGDELTGGAPNSSVEVADYIVGGKMVKATRTAIAWCLAERRCLRDAFNASMHVVGRHLSRQYFDRSWEEIPWLTAKTRELCDHAIYELPVSDYRPLSTRPSAVDACQTWWHLLRTQPHLKPSEIYRYEYLYPYLDRDLVDFLLRVPQHQLAKPGRRRALMRSALVDIVPAQILERRRKAFLLKTPLAEVTSLAPRIISLVSGSVLVEQGYIERSTFQQSVADTISGRDLRWWALILRTINVETWLRAISERQVRLHTTQDSGV